MIRQSFAGALAVATVLAAVMGQAQGPLTPTTPTTASPTATPTLVPVTPKTPTAPAPTTAAPVTTGAVTTPAPVAGTAGVPVAGDPTLAGKPAGKLPKANLYTLQRCLQLADERSPQIKMALDRLAVAHAQLDEAKWVPWSQFSISGGVAMVPELKGSSVYSPNFDISYSNKLGPAFRVGFDGYVPLYTFGKIDNAVAASKAWVQVAVADVQRMKNLLHHDVRRAYFGLQLAHDGRYLLEFARDKLADAIKKAEDDDEIDEPDLLRMKTYHMEVQARLGEVEKGERMALAALRFFAGVEAPAPFEIPEDSIAPPKKPLLHDLVYLQSARVNRPELKQAKANVETRTHQVELAKSRLYPDIGLSMYFGYSTAPIITDQTNPFVVDNANYLRYTVGLSFRWNLDLLPGSARVRFAEASLAEIRDQETFTLGNIGVEVESAYGMAKDAQIREKYYGEAESLAKKWVASISASIAVGTREDRDIIDPLRAYLTNRYNHLMAVMDLDVAYSQLSLATGDESVATY